MLLSISWNLVSFAFNEELWNLRNKRPFTCKPNDPVSAHQATIMVSSSLNFHPLDLQNIVISSSRWWFYFAQNLTLLQKKWDTVILKTARCNRLFCRNWPMLVYGKNILNSWLYLGKISKHNLNVYKILTLKFVNFRLRKSQVSINCVQPVTLLIPIIIFNTISSTKNPLIKILK